MYKNNPTSEATIKETATSIVEVFEKYLLSIGVTYRNDNRQWHKSISE